MNLYFSITIEVSTNSSKSEILDDEDVTLTLTLSTLMNNVNIRQETLLKMTLWFHVKAQTTTPR